MVEVLVQDTHQVALTEDDQPIQTLAARLPSTRSQMALARGERNGVRTTSNLGAVRPG